LLPIAFNNKQIACHLRI